MEIHASLTIAAIEWKPGIGEEVGRCNQETFVFRVCHGNDAALVEAASIGDVSEFNVRVGTMNQAAGSSFLVVEVSRLPTVFEAPSTTSRLASAAATMPIATMTKKPAAVPVGRFRVHINISNDENVVRSLSDELEVRFSWCGRSTSRRQRELIVNQEGLVSSFSSWLHSSCGYLFSDGFDQESPYCLNPSSSALERVLWARDDISLAHSEQRGALVLTSLRLVFIPGFQDISHIVDVTLDGDDSVDIGDVCETLAEKTFLQWSEQELSSFLYTLDTNGDGKISRNELSTFLISKIMAGSPRNGFSVPVARIAKFKVKASTMIEKEEEDEETGGSRSFDEGRIEVCVRTFEVRNKTVVYLIDVRDTVNDRKPWTVERRFSEFETLKASISSVAPNGVPHFPMKKPKFMTSKERRVRKLGNFLSDLLLMPEARNEMFANFLGASHVFDVDEEGGSKAAGGLLDKLEAGGGGGDRSDGTDSDFSEDDEVEISETGLMLGTAVREKMGNDFASALSKGGAAAEESVAKQTIYRVTCNFASKLTFVAHETSSSGYDVVKWGHEVETELNWLKAEAMFPAKMSPLGSAAGVSLDHSFSNTDM